MEYHPSMCLVCGKREVEIVIRDSGDGYCSEECEFTLYSSKEYVHSYQSSRSYVNNNGEVLHTATHTIV